MPISKKTAVYCRLSKDDEKIGESVSIETQKMMLSQFCQENGFSIFDYYVDDGFSGLNFQRPGFQKMLEDVEVGKIDTVITKDLSRLGRDYIQTGAVAEEESATAPLLISASLQHSITSSITLHTKNAALSNKIKKKRKDLRTV